MTTEELVEKYGEENRKLITDALAWVDKKIPVWEVRDFDKEAFIEDLLEHIEKKVE